MKNERFFRDSWWCICHLPNILFLLCFPLDIVSERNLSGSGKIKKTMSRIPKVHYITGWEAEQEARKTLIENGYYVVRSAGSKGLIDLVALKENEILLVQVKVVPHNLKPKFDKECNILKRKKELKGFKKEFWVKQKRNGWYILKV